MFLQKSFKKQQFTNLSLLVTVVAQFTTKTANSKKATRIYILSLMSYSINKPKSNIVITSKNLCFLQKMVVVVVVVVRGGGRCPPVSTALKRVFQKNIKIFHSEMMKNIVINQLLTHYVSSFLHFFIRNSFIRICSSFLMAMQET